jgi:hypothetical protein
MIDMTVPISLRRSRLAAARTGARQEQRPVAAQNSGSEGWLRAEQPEHLSLPDDEHLRGGLGAVTTRRTRPFSMCITLSDGSPWRKIVARGP